MSRVPETQVAVVAADDAYTLLEIRATAGASLSRRTHAREDLTIHVVDGVIALDADGAPPALRPGAVHVVPRGTPFAASVASPAARVLVVAVPGGIERLARMVADDPGGPAPDPDDVAALLAMAGVQPL